MYKLYITKTDNHFGMDNRYVFTGDTLRNAINEAESFVPFQIQANCIHNLENTGYHRQDLYSFSSYES